MFELNFAGVETLHHRRIRGTKSLPAVIRGTVRELIRRYSHLLPEGPFRVEYFQPFTLDGPFLVENHGSFRDPEWVLTVTYQFCADLPDEMEKMFVVEMLTAAYERDARLEREPLMLCLDEHVFEDEQVQEILNAAAELLIKQRRALAAGKG